MPEGVQGLSPSLKNKWMPSGCQDNSLQLVCTLHLHRGAVEEGLQIHRGVVGEEHQTRKGVEEEVHRSLKGVEEQQHQKEEAEESLPTGLVVPRILLAQVVPITGEELL